MRIGNCLIDGSIFAQCNGFNQSIIRVLGTSYWPHIRPNMNLLNQERDMDLMLCDRCLNEKGNCIYFNLEWRKKVPVYKVRHKSVNKLKP